eukprot:TRINITY_DN6405_c1_g2_i1.p1 TRINITY_DN6405_c1_g2~~TRINITY_DN6405_c1_g2_i1.p1  ORF type:complete len:601 (+),score=220.21 TRINITY_DN6405_c1_g2_i1:264-1805(+)
MGDISSLSSKLKRGPVVKDVNVKILPLHSSVPNDQQRRIFESRPGLRKIVLSTNIAETSITIDDVVAVIDSGKVNRTQYDPVSQTPKLLEEWTSQASAIQRKGRAGRVQKGTCYRLYSRSRFGKFIREEEPEIFRVPLQHLCLQIKLLQVEKSVSEFLKKTPSPPSDVAIESAVKFLRDFGALDSAENLTPLGFHVGKLPVDVPIGKMLLFGSIFRCIDPILTIAGIFASKSPFHSSWEQREEAAEIRGKFAGKSRSDALAAYFAYNQWIQNRHKDPEFCEKNFMSLSALKGIEDLKRDFVEQLSEIGFLESGLNSRKIRKTENSDGILEITGGKFNENSTNFNIIRAVICAALYPKIAQILSPEKKYIQVMSGHIPAPNEAKEHKFMLKSKERVFNHPKSVLFSQREYEYPYVVFNEKIQTSKVFITQSTMVSPYSLLLFGGDIQVRHQDEIVMIDEWIRFKAPARIAVLMKEVRSELDGILSHKISDPSMDLSSLPLIEVVTDIVTRDGVL